DWAADWGVKLEVSDVGWWCDDVNELVTEPQDDFSNDHFEHRQLFDAAHAMNGATNVMRVVQMLQRWLRHLTRGDEAAHRWGADGADPHRLIIDLTKEPSSSHNWGSDVVNLMTDTSGRGFDAWDDSVIAHEVGHWLFDKSVHPFPPYKTLSTLKHSLT